MAIGIYSISSPSGKAYVGMTCDSFENRWKGHLKELRSGRHKCTGLKNAFAKYGESDLTFTILESFKTGERTNAEILELEKSWWDTLHQSGVKLYNARPSGTKALTLTRLAKEKHAANIRSFYDRKHGVENSPVNKAGRSLRYTKVCQRCGNKFLAADKKRKMCSKKCCGGDTTRRQSVKLPEAPPLPDCVDQSP